MNAWRRFRRRRIDLWLPTADCLLSTPALGTALASAAERRGTCSARRSPRTAQQRTQRTQRATLAARRAPEDQPSTTALKDLQIVTRPPQQSPQRALAARAVVSDRVQVEWAEPLGAVVGVDAVVGVVEVAPTGGHLSSRGLSAWAAKVGALAAAAVGRVQA